MRKLTGEKLEAELARLEGMRAYEHQYESAGIVCGIDEAGRGPLAGPVVAAVAVLPKDCTILRLNDSKKLSEKCREELFLEIKEKDIARFRRESLGFIFQDFNLLDTLTIEENIALALTINKVSANKIDSQIQQIAAKLNITDILNKYPYQVSGGQKQRCACARAIINHPKLILADEPTGALDSHSSQMLLSTIQEMNEQMDATILMVTHDAFSASYANRILFLRDGEIYKEIMKGSSSRKEFFEQILEVLNTLGGGVNDVR